MCIWYRSYICTAVENTSESDPRSYEATKAHSLYNGYRLYSLLTYCQRGFIAQLVDRCAGIAEVMGLNLVDASEFFLGFICNCFSCFINARVTFTCKETLLTFHVNSFCPFVWFGWRQNIATFGTSIFVITITSNFQIWNITINVGINHN